MKTVIITALLTGILFFPSLSPAVAPAPHISDRELVERLTRLETKLEEGLKANNATLKQLSEEINRRFEDMNRRFEDMNAQMSRMSAVFTAMVIAVFGFAIWDRRTMVRPFEDKVKRIEDDITANRSKLHDLIEALKDLSQTDKKVAEVLKRFKLL